MKLPLERAVEATGATLLDAQAAPAEIRVGTDTRTLRPGDAFVALHGPNFDGHDFTAEAVRAGASVLVIDRAETRVDGVATMVVADTLLAYVALAALARGLFNGRVLAITGSG